MIYLFLQCTVLHLGRDWKSVNRQLRNWCVSITLSAVVTILQIVMRRGLRKDEHKGHCWVLWNVVRDLSTGVNSGSNKDDINSAKVVIQKAASMYKLDHKSVFVERSGIEKRSFAAKWFLRAWFWINQLCVFFFFTDFEARVIAMRRWTNYENIRTYQTRMC